MSYDLTFIKYDKKPRMAASKIYEMLMNGKDVLMPRQANGQCEVESKMGVYAASTMEK